MGDGIRWRRRPSRRQSRQSRPYQGATPRTVWRQSVPPPQQAAGAQFLGECRGRRGAALGRRPTRGARASLPAAPGVAPSPSEVDAGWGEPTGAGGPSHQRSAHGPAARRGAKPRRPKPQARETQSRRAPRRPKAKPKPAARPATRGEWVSRAWSGARSAERKAWGAPVFRDTGGVQTPELPADRPGQGKVALALSRKAAVRSSCSSPVEGGNEQDACTLYRLSTYWR